ncbi:MAG: esterase [Chitinophagaceae bacterium]|nr:esterase [Chitinophagaceae bacterium]
MKPVLVSALLLIAGTASAQVPAVSSGRIERLDSFPSKFVTARHVDIWLPDGYTKEKKYSVLYMHDGQMLYDSAITWNHQAWEVDDVMGKLVNEKRIRQTIVVGIWNGGVTRHPDYFPQKPFEGLTQEAQQRVTDQLKQAGRTKDYFKPNSDNYLRFLVSELKPFIDKNYATLTDRKSTFVAGSSMGGLISIYAICEYPDVFSGVACLSTHWPGIFTADNNPVPGAFVQYLQQHLPDPENHKIYFDHGDQTLDAMYPALQRKVDAVMKGRGFTKRNWKTSYYPGENHSESAWRNRLDVPLLFLLKK